MSPAPSHVSTTTRPGPIAPRYSRKLFGIGAGLGVPGSAEAGADSDMAGGTPECVAVSLRFHAPERTSLHRRLTQDRPHSRLDRAAGELHRRLVPWVSS